MFNRKVRALALVLALTMVPTQIVSADTLDEKQKKVEQKQAETKKSLKSTQSKIDDLETKKKKLQKEIDKMDADLVDLMIDIKTTKADIADKEDEIETTKKDLEEAKADQEEQYDSMKTRIAYIYENGGNAAWAEMILSDSNISDMLNKAEYTQQLYDYDREALSTYVETVEKVDDTEQSLEEDQAELVAMNEENEAEKKELDAALAKKKKTSANYASEIKAAEKKADEYSALIRQQSAEIRKIQQEKAAQEAARKAAEEARRKAAAEKAAAEAAAKKAAAASNSTTTTTTANTTTTTGTTNSTTASTSKSTSTTTTTKSTASTDTSSSSKSTSSSGSQDTGSTVSGGSGGSVASYATRFVGNPYVWGGTSLTNGTDCSGFVMSVYKHFGVSLPHSSGALRSVGRGVSYSEAKAGDIICYSGHVAIYLGGGAIVHASNKKDGIKISYNAAYRSIVAVRRIFG